MHLGEEREGIERMGMRGEGRLLFRPIKSEDRTMPALAPIVGCKGKLETESDGSLLAKML